MEKKKTWLWVLIGLIVVALVGVGVFFFLNKDSKKDSKKEDTKKEEKVDKEQAKPLLFKVTKDGSDTVMYLFGSIHMADDRAYPMRDEIMKAYEDSEYLAVEFDTVAYAKNTQQQMEDLKLLVYTDGTKISDHFEKESYDALVEYLTNNNSYSGVYDVYKPALFYTLVTQVSANKSGLDPEKGIDAYFLNKAHKEDKKVLEVETSSFQYNLLASFSDRFYEAIIMASIVEEEEATNSLKSLYESWLKGDAEGIVKEDSDELDDVDFTGYEDVKDEIERFNNELITKRNETMLKTVEGYFEDGKNTFVVVGAAHIAGDEGLAKGMEKAGYKVELVEYK